MVYAVIPIYVQTVAAVEFLVDVTEDAVVGKAGVTLAGEVHVLRGQGHGVGAQAGLGLKFNGRVNAVERRAFFLQCTGTFTEDVVVITDIRL